VVQWIIRTFYPDSVTVMVTIRITITITITIRIRITTGAIGYVLGKEEIPDLGTAPRERGRALFDLDAQFGVGYGHDRRIKGWK